MYKGLGQTFVTLNELSACEGPDAGNYTMVGTLIKGPNCDDIGLSFKNRKLVTLYPDHSKLVSDLKSLKTARFPEGGNMSKLIFKN